MPNAGVEAFMWHDGVWLNVLIQRPTASVTTNSLTFGAANGSANRGRRTMAIHAKTEHTADDIYSGYVVSSAAVCHLPRPYVKP